MRHLLFLVNPIAGKGRSIRVVPDIEKHLSGRTDLTYEIVVSTAAGELTSVVQKRQSEGVREFIAVGGDGTISEMINGLDFDSQHCPTIGVIPAGRGNDFARNFDRNTLDDVMVSIIENRTQRVDVGQVNDYFFLNSCSFGIDGPICLDAYRFKKVVPGELSYLLATLKQLAVYRAKRVVVEVGGQTYDSEILLAAVSNGRYFGGGMQVSPHADLQDGMLDLCKVDRVSSLRFLMLFPRIYRGKLEGIPEVSYHRFEEMRVIPRESSLMLNIDGNIVGEITEQNPAHIRIRKQAIQLFGCWNESNREVPV